MTGLQTGLLIGGTWLVGYYIIGPLLRRVCGWWHGRK